MCSKNIFGNAQININLDNSSVSSTFDTVNCTTLNATTANIDTSIISTNLTAPLSTITTGNITTLNATTINNSGVLTSDSITCDNTLNTDFLTASGDIICNTLDGNVEAVDLTVNNYCDILGPRNATEANAGCYIGHILTDDFGLNLVSNATGGSVINFTKPNTAHIGSIDFDNTNEAMGFVINAVNQLLLDGTTADFIDNAITTTSRLTCNDVYSKGDISFINPTNPEASINYDFVEESFNFYTAGNFATPKLKITSSTTTLENDLDIVGDLIIDNDLLFCDSGTERVGIGTSSPESKLQIVGARQGVPTTVGVHIGHSSGTNYGLELCSLSTASSGIDFTQPNSNRRGSIGYNNSTNIFTISTNDSQTQLTIQDGLLDAQDCDITTTGDITCQDLTVNGSFSSSQSLQDIYNNDDVEPHIIINQSHPVTFQGHASVTNTFQCRNTAGTNVFEVSRDGDITCENANIDGNAIILGSCTTGALTTDNANLTVNGQSTITGNLTVNSNATVSSLLSCDNFKCNGTLGTVDIGIFAGMDGDVPNLRLSGDSNKDASISLDVLGQKMFTIYHDALNSYTHFYVVGTTYDVMKFNYQGVHMPLNCHITGYLNCFGNLNCTSTMRVNTTSNMVKIGGTTEPASSLHVIGPRQTTPLSKGCHFGYGASSDAYGMEICSAVNNNSVLDFTEEGSDYRGRILYNPSLERFDFSANGALQFVLSNNEANFQNQVIRTTGDLNITTNNTLYTDSTNGHVGIGTSSPESALHVVGAREGVPQTVGCHFGHSSGVNYGIELCSVATASSGIDFTKPNSNRRGAIAYNNSTEEMSFTANNGVQFTLNTSTADFKDNNIITTGIIDANLNSTRGQLITYHGEENGQLNIDSFDFNYGNGSVSDSNFAPMMPCSVKLKKFTYIGGGGSNPTTSTKYVFRAYIDGVASSIYAYVDFSNTTNGNITRHKFCNKFSSSSSSQVDLTDAQATLTNSGAGIQISWRTITKTSGSSDNKHRFGWIVETIEDL